MPIIIAILTLVGGAIWWWVRNNPRDAMSVADDAVTIARNAPRKLAFRRQTKEHPVQGIDDPRLAVATLSHAYLQLDTLPTQEQNDRLHVALRKVLRFSAEEAEEMDALSRFLFQSCGGADETISRVARRLFKIDGAASWDALTEALSAAVEDAPTARQKDAIEDMRRALHIR